ncbi:DMT family transporter [Tuberibacillus calidus]|uniref:DMT family transporter n=1 Tax=Tuberibacillus calidus TaxID=340097 RepID=UPI001B7F9948|nr:DMT family transporter [Tuberibacillus calidus]
MKQIMGPLFLSLAATIWGGMYVASKFAFSAVPPMTMLFLRYVIAGIILTGVCFGCGQLKMTLKGWGYLAQIGAIGYFASISAQFIGTDLANAHLGSLVTTLSPMFLSLFAVMLLKEKMTKKQLVMFAIAIVGVIIIIGAPKDGESHILGIFVLLLAAVTWGYYSVVVKQAAIYYTPLQMTTAGIWIACFLSLPFACAQWDKWPHHVLLEPAIFFSILYISVISTACAFFAWNIGLKLTPSHHAGLYFFLQPVVGSFFGWLFLGEKLGISFFIGSLLILLSVGISEYKKESPNLEIPSEKTSL